MAKLPSFQFYPGDWKKDAGVQALSYEERGVWFELMLMMFESPERGKLIFRTGIPIPEDAVARALGLDKQKVNQILSKLLEYGVASKEEETGIIYCRRMVRDAELSKTRAEAGKLGGNPDLLKQNGSKTEAKRKQKPTPSSSTSTSYKDRDRKGEFSLEEFLEAARLPDVGLSEKDTKECYDHYAAQGFLRGNGCEIASLPPILREWKRRKGAFDAPPKGALPKREAITLEQFRLAYRDQYQSEIDCDICDSKPHHFAVLRCATIDDVRERFREDYDDILALWNKEFSPLKRRVINKLERDKCE